MYLACDSYTTCLRLDCLCLPLLGSSAQTRRLIRRQSPHHLFWKVTVLIRFRSHTHVQSSPTAHSTTLTPAIMSQSSHTESEPEGSPADWDQVDSMEISTALGHFMGTSQINEVVASELLNARNALQDLDICAVENVSMWFQ